MSNKLDRCRRCGAVIPEQGTVYGDHNRKFCSEACARTQLDFEQGIGHHRAQASNAPPAAGDRVGRDGGPAERRGYGPSTR